MFSDRRSSGAYAVTDTRGAVVANIRTGRGGSFVATAATGATICAASAGRWGMSNVWRVTDATGAPLLEVRKHTFKPIADVRRGRGGELTVEGSIWRRDFRVRAGDEVVLSAAPRTRAFSLRPYEYAVQASDALRLDEILAVVQIWRAARKRDDTTAAVAASTAVVAGG